MSISFNRGIAAALLSSCALTAMSAAAFAQQTAQTPAAGLEEITVTAERFESNLQTTPVAISAFSADALETRQITNVMQAAAAIPGVIITPATGTSNAARIVMRGAGQENSGILFDPAVGVYIDNVYQPRINGQFFDFFDIERLEVLRGPQGTLYGRNSNGGAIKIVTKKPSDTFTAAGDIAFGSYQQLDARAYIAGPIVADKLSASVSAVSRKRDGWTADANYSQKLNNKNQQAARAKLYFTPTDDIKIDIAADVQKDRSDPGLGSPVQTGYISNNPALGQIDPKAVVGRNLFETELSGPYANKNDSTGFSVNASYDVSPNLTFNSITGYRNQRSSLATIFVVTLTGLNVGSSYQMQDHFFSEEVNGTFKFDRFKGVAGLYYFDETGNQQDGVPYPYSTPDTRYRKTKAWAGYGQVTYDIIDGLGVTGGIRYTHEQADFTQFYYTQVNFAQSASKTFTAWSPKVGIDWQALPDLLVYASFTKGFKSGGFNAVAPLTNVGGPAGSFAGPTPYDPETVKSYEAGVKFTTDDHRLRVNLAVFQADYGGLQLPVFFPGTTNTYTSNASGGRVRGIELEPTWQITESFQVYGMGSFSDNKYTGAFNCSLYNSSIVNCGLGGTAAKIKGVVPAKTVLGFLFTPQLNIPGSVSLTGNWQHASKYFNNVSNTLDIVQTPTNDLFDASISWDSSDKHWRVSLEGKNLTDKRFAAESLQLASPIRASVTAYPNDPRTVDVRVRFQW